MATKREIEDDIKKDFGAVVSVGQLMKYTGMSRNWVRDMLAGLDKVGADSSKQYFYKDVAQKLVDGF